MKINKVDPYYLRVPMRRKVADSFNVAAHVGLAGVQLFTDKGLVGNGFTATLAAGDDLIRDTIEHYYAPLLMGRDPHYVKQIWQDLYWSALHWVGRQGITTMAMAAVDIALWDLIAKAAEQPLWAILGGAKARKIKTYNTDAGWLNMSVNEMTTYMKQIIDQGWTGVKMKVGKPDPREDYERVRAVRKSIGDKVDLMVDVNQTWDLNTAMVWGKRLEEFQIGWLEEPLAPEDIRSHRILARELNTPIALGEHIYSKEVFRDYLLEEAVEIIQVDVTRVAGVTEWMQTADMAGCFNCPVIPHTADGGLVHQHLVAATQNSPMQETVLPYGVELFLHPVDIREGWLHIPEDPGASTEFKPDQFAKLRVA
jgi:L-alanine-DL-glutamate epimerase-like enolase superfamily enzyme